MPDSADASLVGKGFEPEMAHGRSTLNMASIEIQ